ncbi:hypothetical protein ACLB2K_060968 [Fragaria x ananassa]
MSANDKAVAALEKLGKGFERMGNGLGFVAVVGVIYLGFKLSSLNYSVELIFSKDEPQTETKTKAGKEGFTCGDCNKKAVCSTCTQKVCAVCKQKPCSS